MGHPLIPAEALALALTAALAACGSDEPSGGTGPDRTASTPTETPASPTRTASTPVPSPTATDAPGTAAATAPPAVSGFAEMDREALVALYNATNDENWEYSKNWLSDAPLGEWYGVTTNDDGRVTGLDLRGNDLSGAIPAELASLSNLEHLDLSTNNLSGEIPPELGSLSNLGYLGLSTNDLGGEIPPELGSLSNLGYLGLSTNDLGEEIPAELGSLSNLLILDANDLSGLEDPCFSLKPRALSRGRTAYRPEGAPSACLTMAHFTAEKRGISLSLRWPPGRRRFDRSGAC